MKKLLGLLLAAALVLSLAACGGKGGEDEFVLTRGQWDEYTYKNSSMGFEFTLNEEWTILDDESFVSTFLPDVDPEEFSRWTNEDFKKSRVIPCAFARRNDNFENVSLVIENLKLSGGTKSTPEEYLDIAAESLPEADYVITRPRAVKLGEADGAYIVAATQINGMDVNQYMVATKADNYMMVITFTTVDETSVDEFLDMFS